MYDLSYTVTTGVLNGTLGGKNVYLKCWSGGRGGAKKEDGSLNKKVWDNCLVNNPFKTDTKHYKYPLGDTGFTPIGGSIPVGRYKMTPNFYKENGKIKIKENWVNLLPLNKKDQVISKTENGRNGLAIHGRGPEGSQGCIVVSQEAFDAYKNIIFSYIKRIAGEDYEVEKENVDKWLLDKYPILNVIMGLDHLSVEEKDRLSNCKTEEQLEMAKPQKKWTCETGIIRKRG